MITFLALGVDNCTPFFAISSAMGFLAPGVHAMVIQAITEMPGIANSSAVFS